MRSVFTSIAPLRLISRRYSQRFFVSEEGEFMGDVNAEGSVIINNDNCCDGSLYSEALSADLLSSKREYNDYKVYKTETTIKYKIDNLKKIDYILRSELTGEKVGVEVKRIDTFGGKSDMDIRSIVENACMKIESASNNVVSSDRWSKSILHILTSCSSVADEVVAYISSEKESFYDVVYISVVKDSSGKVF